MSAEQSVLVEGLEERPEPRPVTGLGVPGQPRLPERKPTLCNVRQASSYRRRDRAGRSTAA